MADTVPLRLLGSPVEETPTEESPAPATAPLRAVVRSTLPSSTEGIQVAESDPVITMRTGQTSGIIVDDSATDGLLPREPIRRTDVTLSPVQGFIEKWAKGNATQFFASPAGDAGQTKEWRYYRLPLSLYLDGLAMLQQRELTSGVLRTPEGVFGYFGAVDNPYKTAPSFFGVVLKDKAPGSLSPSMAISDQDIIAELAKLSIEPLGVRHQELPELAYLRRWVERRAVGGRGVPAGLQSMIYTLEGATAAELGALLSDLGGGLKTGPAATNALGLDLKGESWGVAWRGGGRGPSGLMLPGTADSVASIQLFSVPAKSAVTVVPLPAPFIEKKKRDIPWFEIGIFGAGIVASGTIGVATLGAVVIFGYKGPKKRRKRR